MKYDFAGWASKNNIRCADGRTIRPNAFKDCDGKTVPLVFMHNHKDIDNVLGHALLENRPEGMYAYCSLNNSTMAQVAKEAVQHGDLTALSIYANQLKEKNGNVFHGRIREVSLVLAGANDEALIEYPIIEHSDGSWEYDLDADGIVVSMASGEGTHLDAGGEIDVANEDEVDEELSHADEDITEEEKKPVAKRNLEAIIKGLPKEDQDVIYAAFDYAVKHAGELGKVADKATSGGSDEEDEDDDEGASAKHYDDGGNDMKYNVFEGGVNDNGELSHSDLMDLQSGTLNDAKSYGSLKDSFMAHAAEYGIDNLDYLFPEAKQVNGNTPEFIDRKQEWVKYVMAHVHHTPFSRIKTVYADITEDEARARGYLKGNRKKEEVFGLLRRTTTPCTVYKKQKMDRDDIIDITDFDVVAWLKGEMRGKLDEELARAFLFSDGRSTLSEDKISEEHIRPIVKENDLFCITKEVTAESTNDLTVKSIIRTAIKSRKDYRGTGNPVAFMTEDLLSDMLLLTDEMGRDLYESEQKLATKLRVSEIITVPDEIMPTDMYMLIVNLTDYNVGADKGGSINMFEDFDIDYNQEKYLIETRCSGALVKPYSAIVLKKKA